MDLEQSINDGVINPHFFSFRNSLIKLLWVMSIVVTRMNSITSTTLFQIPESFVLLVQSNTRGLITEESM